MLEQTRRQRGQAVATDPLNQTSTISDHLLVLRFVLYNDDPSSSSNPTVTVTKLVPATGTISLVSVLDLGSTTRSLKVR